MLEQDELKYVFFGSALAVDVSIGQPTKDFLIDQTSAVLAPSGGYAVQTREQTNFREIVRTGRVSATIIGNSDSADHFSTVATATVENLDILGVIKADAIVSRVAARAPKRVVDDGDMHPTTFFFHGSMFHGLKINGKHYEPTVADVAVDIPKDGDRKPLYEVTPDNGYKLRANSVGYKQILVGHERKRPQDPFLEFPEFGRIFVGEFDFFKGRVTLSMLRVELGCAVKGSVTGPVACVNGHPPPLKRVP